MALLQLLVRVPDQVSEDWGFWDSASLRLLGAATGIYADSIYVRIGNPVIAAIVSIVAGVLILFIPTYFIRKQDPTANAQKGRCLDYSLDRMASQAYLFPDVFMDLASTNWNVLCIFYERQSLERD